MTDDDPHRRLLAGSPALAAASAGLPAFAVPWAELAADDGWVVWLGHPPVPDGLALLPVPGSLLWDAPPTALGVAAVAATAYAARRGAADPDVAAALLRREAPVALIVPDEVHPSLDAAVAELSALGVPVLYGRVDPAALGGGRGPFAARRSAHAVDLGRPHDPALAAQPVSAVETMGGNSLSSFVLHPEGERDTTTVIGAPGPRLAIEIGVRIPGLQIAGTERLQAAAAEMPAFLDGVVSQVEGHSLEIGWHEGARPSPETLGGAFRAWLKASWGAELVDVRIAFAPPKGRSALLTDMRARAAAFAELRTDLLAADADQRPAER